MVIHENKKVLARHISLKVGGCARYWIEPEDSYDVLEAVSMARKNELPFFIIGNGTNILASDNGFRGIVIKLSRNFDFIRQFGDEIIEVGASTPVAKLVKQCSTLGLGGCEFLSGIPGTIGGAIFMNAGVRDVENREKMKEIKDIVIDVDAVDLESRKRVALKRNEIDFDYRSSGLDGKCILGARIRLEKDAKSDIINRINSYMDARGWMKGLGYPSCGSVFKNPENNAAGRLIENCGLKGKRIGGAEISRMHANFIVNTGKAKSKDILDLIDLARNSVRDRFNIDLELELKII